MYTCSESPETMSFSPMDDAETPMTESGESRWLGLARVTRHRSMPRTSNSQGRGGVAEDEREAGQHDLRGGEEMRLRLGVGYISTHTHTHTHTRCHYLSTRHTYTHTLSSLDHNNHHTHHIIWTASNHPPSTTPHRRHRRTSTEEEVQVQDSRTHPSTHSPPPTRPTRPCPQPLQGTSRSIRTRRKG